MLRRTGFKKPAYDRPPVSLPAPVRRASLAVITDAVLARPKSPRYVDKHLLAMARGKPCLLRSPLCNHNPETTVACHGAGLANGKGMGYKTGDELTCWGCSDCNHFTDAYGGADAAQKANVFEAGHKRQLMAWRGMLSDPATTDRDRASVRAVLQRLGG